MPTRQAVLHAFLSCAPDQQRTPQEVRTTTFVNPAFNGPANPLSNFSESLQILSPRHHWFLAGPGLRGESILSYPILLPLTRVESPQIDHEQFSSPSASNPPLGSRFVFSPALLGLICVAGKRLSLVLPRSNDHALRASFISRPSPPRAS